MPNDLIGDSKDASIKAQKENARLAAIQATLDVKGSASRIGVKANSVVKMGPFDKNRPGSTQGQLLLPEAINPLFKAICVDGTTNPQVEGAGVLSYLSNTQQAEWNVIKVSSAAPAAAGCA
jgi:hypothetical protein